jgi:hypothetical protein
LKIRVEYRKFDLSVGSNDYFKEIFNFDCTGNLDKIDYPLYFELLLEHENDFKTVFVEMAKLTYEKAKLKVLITYPEKPKHIEYLVGNFSNIIKQSNSTFKENQETEYLLIYGMLNESKVDWHFNSFDINGFKKELC